MESGRYHDIIYHDVIHYDIIKMGIRKKKKKKWRKMQPTFAINLQIFWFDFSKAINLY